MTALRIGRSRPRQSGSPDAGTLRAKAYTDLKTLILRGKLKPGERLAETDLARRLGVSRTPLREALTRLEQDGLIIGKPHLGYVVIDLDAKALLDLLNIREVLDMHAATEAVRHASERDLARLRAVMARIERLNDRDSRSVKDIAEELELGLRIHEVIAEATGNRYLVESLTRIYERLQLALWLEILWVDKWDNTLEEHRAIVDAVCRRDGAAAAAAARAHVQTSRDNILRLAEAKALQMAVGGS
jgi:DNA-binding GntR family transcriptional regulator